MMSESYCIQNEGLQGEVETLWKNELEENSEPFELDIEDPVSRRVLRFRFLPNEITAIPARFDTAVEQHAILEDIDRQATLQSKAELRIVGSRVRPCGLP